jgi:DNA-directed RNA polymerase specialized sigma24 family protein
MRDSSTGAKRSSVMTDELPGPAQAPSESHERPANGRPKLHPERWVDEYGDVLLGFAAARVRDRAIAQDLVQETFLAAIKASESFAGRSTERSWLFGILRNKLVDHIAGIPLSAAGLAAR